MLKLFRKFIPTNISLTRKKPVQYYYPLAELDDEGSITGFTSQVMDAIETDSGIDKDSDIFDDVAKNYALDIPPNVEQLNDEMIITDNPIELNNWQ